MKSWDPRRWIKRSIPADDPSALWPVTFTGFLMYYCFPYRRAVVMSNIQHVFGDQLNQAQRVRLAQAFYSHLLCSVKETLGMCFLSQNAIRDRVEVQGHENLMHQASQERGVLILTGHFGSWEFAPLGGILNFKAFQGHFHFIRRSLGFGRLQSWLFKRYERAGLKVILKENAMTQVQAALEKNHAVVFVLDQHASLANRDGVAVEFFGEKAGTYRSLASLSRHLNIPVVPAASYRLPNGKHVLAFYEPLVWQEYPTTQESIYQNTLAYNQALERIILANPPQWMWSHRRWKLR